MLAHDDDALADESARERLFDILMKRLEAMAPYREGLREVTAWVRRDAGAALAMNPVMLNAMRFMMEAARIDVEGGAAGAIKTQGLALAWARIVGVWLDDSDPGLSKTMAEVDRELTRGERAVAGVDRINAFASPLRGLVSAAFEFRRSAGKRPDRARSSGDEDEGKSAAPEHV